MTVPLPSGLISIVSTAEVDPVPEHPADIRYQRSCALYNFWKVHHAQWRASANPTDYRCQHFFWRIWSNPKLSKLSEASLIQLWISYQQPIKIEPLSSESEKTVNRRIQTNDRNVVRPSTCEEWPRVQQLSPAPSSSVTNLRIGSYTSSSSDREGLAEASSSKQGSQTSSTRPQLSRTTSGKGKRTSFAAGTKTGRSRPSITRKRSSQTGQSSDNAKPARPILKSPRVSSTDPEPFAPAIRKTPSPDPVALSTTRDSEKQIEHRVSVFELGTPASWQSVDSDIDSRGPSKGDQSKSTATLSIERDFREKFNEQIKKNQSSSNLESANRVMRKTGSVVRFADDVDVPEELKRVKATNAFSSQLRKSESALPSRSNSWRGKPQLQHRDSTGSVAAVSEDESEDEEEGLNLGGLPRVRSALSLGIDAIKRSRSSRSSNQSDDNELALTSPQIEEEQDALITGKRPRRKTEEEEKLLAMGRQDGVTKEGGINLRREQTLINQSNDLPAFDIPEPPIF